MKQIGRKKKTLAKEQLSKHIHTTNLFIGRKYSDGKKVNKPLTDMCTNHPST